MELYVAMSALQTGAQYGLIALGYFLFFRGTTAVNFSMGAYVMVAAMAASWIVSEKAGPVALAASAGLGAAMVLSWITEAGILRPIAARTHAEFGAVLAIIALMFVIEQVTGLAFGRQPLVGAPFVDREIEVGSSAVSSQDILALVVTLATFLAAASWLRHGRYGRMVRAVGDNERAARVLGLPVRRVRTAAVVATGLVCGIAGVLVSAQTPVDFHTHLALSIAGFLAFVIGGAGSAWAPLLGGAILGGIEVLAARFVGGWSRDFVLLALVLLVFTLRPEGLVAIRVRP